MKRKSFAPGKIILSGEHAVVFGYRAVAIPVPIGITATFEEDVSLGKVLVAPENDYLSRITELCSEINPQLSGRLTVSSLIPIGKGVGSSSASVIAVVRALLGTDTREDAERIERVMTPNVSGLDFAVIWENMPLIFKKGATPETYDTPRDMLKSAVLIDTGKPDETTNDLVAWVKSREQSLTEPLKKIGDCTERLVHGEELSDIMREHHRAQVALGVVPALVQDLVSTIESSGGAAKVVGAGGRLGGAGLVLALGDSERIRSIADEFDMPILSL